MRRPALDPAPFADMGWGEPPAALDAAPPPGCLTAPDLVLDEAALIAACRRTEALCTRAAVAAAAALAALWLVARLCA